MPVDFNLFNGTPLCNVKLIIDEEYLSNGRKNSGGDVIAKLMPGTGVMGGFRPGGTKSPFYVLESTGNSIDWIDRVDKINGVLTYFGDNREPGKDIHSTSGNVVLRDSFEKLFLGKRDEIPVFFYFEGAGGRNRRFVGLIVPGDGTHSVEDQLVAVWRSKNGQRYQNYKASFSILDVSGIDRRWLDDIKQGNSFGSVYAPKVWKDWVGTGVAKKIKATPVIAHRTPAQQIPSDAKELEILKAVYNYFQDPYQFEYCAMKLAELMDSNIIDMHHTQFTKDGGRDAIGKYHIGSYADGIDVEFSLEAKCYNPEGGGLGVKELSRVISRLRFRQFGILITTSYLNQDAYKELKEDRHPVIVMAGADIVKILYDNGYKTKKEVIDWLQQFDPGKPKKGNKK